VPDVRRAGYTDADRTLRQFHALSPQQSLSRLLRDELAKMVRVKVDVIGQ